jgi:hypothetical protein
MASTTRIARALLSIATVLAVAVPALAQNEAALRAAFEGRRVVVRIDMPGSSDGVDVRVDPPRAMDLNRYRNDLKRYGTAIHAGDSAMVTLVKVKKDLIEFQLDGGGFGTFGDDTSTSVNMPDIPKSDREKTLEKEIKDEKDASRRRSLQAELDRLRQRREAENRVIAAERTRAEEAKKVRIMEDRLRGGSRFNLRYDDRVPDRLHAEDVTTALAEYVDFKAAPPAAAPRAADASKLRKGMLRDEVEQLFGRGSQLAQQTVGDFKMVTLVFTAGEQRITADFVEDVLVRYAIASK